MSSVIYFLAAVTPAGIRMSRLHVVRHSPATRHSRGRQDASIRRRPGDPRHGGHTWSVPTGSKRTEGW